MDILLLLLQQAAIMIVVGIAGGWLIDRLTGSYKRRVNLLLLMKTEEEIKKAEQVLEEAKRIEAWQKEKIREQTRQQD